MTALGAAILHSNLSFRCIISGSRLKQVRPRARFSSIEHCQFWKAWLVPIPGLLSFPVTRLWRDSQLVVCSPELSLNHAADSHEWLTAPQYGLGLTR